MRALQRKKERGNRRMKRKKAPSNVGLFNGRGRIRLKREQ
jgi:hypothetical protein